MQAMAKDKSVGFLLQWICVNLLSFYLAEILIYLPSFFNDGYGFFAPYGSENLLPQYKLFLQSIIISLIFSLSFGTAQWLTLRNWVPNIKKWIGINILAWVIGYQVSWIIFIFCNDSGVATLVLGVLIWEVDYFISRKYFHYSIWWIFLWTLIGMLIILGLLLGEKIFFYDVFAIAIFSGIPVTGLFLVFLLEHPNKIWVNS